MKQNKIRLGVNIDHVATVRNARGGETPCPLRAALLACESGADGITAHLREDRRHISDYDIARLMAQLTKPLNLEMAATDEMFQIALLHKPHAICLVPEKREEKTTEGGLDLGQHKAHYHEFIKRLSDIGSRISLFLDPNALYIETAIEFNVPVIELHTGAYCQAIVDGKHGLAEHEFQKLWQAAEFAGKNGLEVHAGHGISYETVQKIATLPYLAELNIGHFLIGDSIFIGLGAAIQHMKDLIHAQ